MRALLRAAPAVVLLLVTSAAGCGDDPAAPPTGEVRLTVTTAGDDPDESGYTVVLDDAAKGTVQPNGVFTVTGVSRGEHEVRLDAMSENCGAGENPRLIQVADAATTDVAFAVTCGAMIGSVRVTAQTGGPERDLNGYTVVVNGAHSAAVPANGVVAIPGVRAGAVSLEISDVADNCESTVVDSAGAQLGFAETLDFNLHVECHGTAALRVTAATSGEDVPDGYTVRVSSAEENGYWYHGAVSASGEMLMGEIGAGEYDVSLGDLTANCTRGDPETRRIVLLPGETGELDFTIACVEAPLIMFATSITGTEDIGIVKSNGRGYALVPGGVTSARREPDWAPGGARIAYTSLVDFNPEIFVMDADGGGVVRLTSNASSSFAPAWSPDGSRIAFVSTRHGNQEIYVMLADGSGVTRLTTHPAMDAEPAWSPDGTKIVFRSDRDGDAEIHVMNADGTGVVALTTNTTWDGYPAWSPDGSSIAFIGCSLYYDACYDSRLFVMRADGSGAVALHAADVLSEPAWSADGEWIAFVETCYYYYYCYSGVGLRVVRPDGTGGFLVLDGSVSSPSWRR